MAPVVAVVGAVVGFVSGLAGVGAAVLTGSSILATGLAGQVLAVAAWSAISYGVNKMMAPEPIQPSFSAEARQRQQLVRSAVASRKHVYGEAMISGPMVFAANSGTGNRYIHLVVPLAAHECDEVVAVYFNEKVSTEYGAAGFRLNIHLGSADQVADTDLMAELDEWTEAHRLRGITYIYIRFDTTHADWKSGLPSNIKALVKGHKLYDPREPAHDPDDSTTWEWSDNAALVVQDYVRGTYGLGATDAEINQAEMIAAANICDELAATPDGGTQKRYTCNGVVDTAHNPADNMDALCSAMAGSWTDSQGKVVVYPGAYTVPDGSLDDDDLRGPIKIRPRSPRQELFNTVRGVYVCAENRYQPSDFPQVTNAAYVTQDGGETIARDIDLPFTNDAIMAQRIAQIVLKRARQPIIVEFPAKWSALDMMAGQNITLTLRAGRTPEIWTDKVFKITTWALSPDGGGVDLVLEEEASDSYTWSADDATAVDTAPDSNFVALRDVVDPPQGLAVVEELYETRDGAGVKAKAVFTWTASLSPYITGYLPEYKLVADSVWLALPQTEDLLAEAVDMTPGIYNFRVRAVNVIGYKSEPVTLTKEITGLLARPADMTGLTISAISGIAILQWDLAPDLDVRIGGKVWCRHSSLLSGATWEASQDIGTALTGAATVAVLPLIAGTYLLKFVDSSGLTSEIAATVTTTAPNILQFANVDSLTESPGFSGDCTNCAADSGTLKLVGVGLFDDIADFDAVSDLDSYGGIVVTGTYGFAGGIDMGSKTRCRVTASITVTCVNVLDKFDDRTANIDDWEDFDGTSAAPTDAQIWMRTTDDDPLATPVWSEWQRLVSGDVDARALDFELRLRSDDPAYNIYVTGLSISVDEVV